MSVGGDVRGVVGTLNEVRRIVVELESEGWVNDTPLNWSELRNDLVMAILRPKEPEWKKTVMRRFMRVE